MKTPEQILADNMADEYNNRLKQPLTLIWGHGAIMEPKMYNNKVFDNYKEAHIIETNILKMLNYQMSQKITIVSKPGDKFTLNDAIVNVNNFESRTVSKSHELELECVGGKEYIDGHPIVANQFSEFGIFSFQPTFMNTKRTWQFGASILQRKMNKILNYKTIGILYHSNNKLSNRFFFIPSITVNKYYNRLLPVKNKSSNCDDYTFKFQWDLMTELYHNNEIIVDDFFKLERFFLNWRNNA